MANEMVSLSAARLHPPSARPAAELSNPSKPQAPPQNIYINVKEATPTQWPAHAGGSVDSESDSELDVVNIPSDLSRCFKCGASPGTLYILECDHRFCPNCVATLLHDKEKREVTCDLCYSVSLYPGTGQAQQPQGQGVQGQGIKHFAVHLRLDSPTDKPANVAQLQTGRIACMSCFIEANRKKLIELSGQSVASQAGPKGNGLSNGHKVSQANRTPLKQGEIMCKWCRCFHCHQCSFQLIHQACQFAPNRECHEFFPLSSIFFTERSPVNGSQSAPAPKPSTAGTSNSLAPPILKVKFCEKHPNQLATHVCKSCNSEPICQLCAASAHDAHRIFQYSSFRRQANVSLVKVQKAKETMDHLDKYIKDQMVKLGAERDKIRTSISSETEALHKRIMSLENDLQARLQLKYKEIEQEYQVGIDGIAAVRQNLNSCLEMGSSAEDGKALDLAMRNDTAIELVESKLEELQSLKKYTPSFKFEGCADIHRKIDELISRHYTFLFPTTLLLHNTEFTIQSWNPHESKVSDLSIPNALKFELSADIHDIEDRREPNFTRIIYRGAGTCLAIDEANRCVKEFNPMGILLNRWKCLGQPTALTELSDSEFVVIEYMSEDLAASDQATSDESLDGSYKSESPRSTPLGIHQSGSVPSSPMHDGGTKTAPRLFISNKGKESTKSIGEIHTSGMRSSNKLNSSHSSLGLQKKASASTLSGKHQSKSSSVFGDEKNPEYSLNVYATRYDHTTSPVRMYRKLLATRVSWCLDMVHAIAMNANGEVLVPVLPARKALQAWSRDMQHVVRELSISVWPELFSYNFKTGDLVTCVGQHVELHSTRPTKQGTQKMAAPASALTKNNPLPTNTETGAYTVRQVISDSDVPPPANGAVLKISGDAIRFKAGGEPPKGSEAIQGGSRGKQQEQEAHWCPAAVSVMPSNGNIMVYDKLGQRVIMFDSEGKFLRTILSDVENCTDLTVDIRNRVWVVTQNEIRVFA